MTRDTILAAILALPPEDQWQIRDAIPKRPRGHPPGSVILPIKTLAMEMLEALPATMTELEKIEVVRAHFPKLTQTALQKIIAGKDWRFNRHRKSRLFVR